MNYTTHIADLIEQLVADNYNRHRHFDIWQETNNQANKDLFHKYADRVEKARAELTAHGFDMKAAQERRANRLLSTAA